MYGKERPLNAEPNRCDLSASGYVNLRHFHRARGNEHLRAFMLLLTEALENSRVPSTEPEIDFDVIVLLRKTNGISALIALQDVEQQVGQTQDLVFSPVLSLPKAGFFRRLKITLLRRNILAVPIADFTL
jgi:hypothetical protein